MCTVLSDFGGVPDLTGSVLDPHWSAEASV